MRHYLYLATGSCLAMSAGLVFVLLIGHLSWSAGRGLPGILIGSVTALVAAFSLSKGFGWKTSLTASCIGALIGCYFAIASAEVFPAGSVEWMWKGGLYGAVFAIPITLLLSPLGVLENRQ